VPVAPSGPASDRSGRELLRDAPRGVRAAMRRAPARHFPSTPRHAEERASSCRAWGAPGHGGMVRSARALGTRRRWESSSRRRTIKARMKSSRTLSSPTTASGAVRRMPRLQSRAFRGGAMRRRVPRQKHRGFPGWSTAESSAAARLSQAIGRRPGRSCEDPGRRCRLHGDRRLPRGAQAAASDRCSNCARAPPSCRTIGGHRCTLEAKGKVCAPARDFRGGRRPSAFHRW